MDALFGLPRKKSAGISYKAPLLGNLFFGEQSSVDLFVAECNKSKSMSAVSFCSVYIHSHVYGHLSLQTGICCVDVREYDFQTSKQWIETIILCTTLRLPCLVICK